MKLDITKCKGIECPIKENCYRFVSKESDWQPYLMESPFKDGECEMYWGENSESIFNQLKKITKNKTYETKTNENYLFFPLLNY